MTEKAQLDRLFAFDSLRVLAVCLLLFHHSDIYGYPFAGISIQPFESYVGIFLNGSFFFVSGFFTYRSMQSRAYNPLAFYKSKFIRLFPPYWLALALFMLILGFSLRKRDVLIYALGLQAIFSPAIAKPLLTLWFVGVIIAYFVGFGIILKITRSWYPRLFFIAAFFALPYFIHLTTGIIDVRFFLYFLLFAAGVLLSDSKIITKALLSRDMLWIRFLVALLGVLGYWWALASGLETHTLLYITLADSFILSWIILFLAIFSQNNAKPLHPLWGAIAYASFFAYLYHRPIWQILINLFNVSPGLPEALWKLAPGSILTLIISNYFQKGYDWLISKFSHW